MTQWPPSMLGGDEAETQWMGTKVEEEGPAPQQAKNSALSSLLLHALFVAVLILLPAKMPSVPEPARREPIIPIVPFEPIPEVRVPPMPSGSPTGRGKGGVPAPPQAPPAGTADDLRPPGPDPSRDSRAGERERPPATASEAPAPEPQPPAAQAASPAGEAARNDSERGEQTSRFDVGKALRDFRPAPVRKPPEGNAGGTRGGGLGSIKGLNIPDLPPLPDSGFGFGNLQFESRDYDFTDYARQIYMAIWRAWHNRLYLSVDSFEKWSWETQTAYLDHRSRIRFRIDASGQVSGVALEQTSGCPALDASAMDALREVVLPPLPSDFPRSQETVHAVFLATGEVQAMRPSLRYLKSMGLF